MKFNIQVDDVTIRFRPAAMASGLWIDPHQYHHEDFAAMEDILCPGATFIDVGANIGLYAVKAAQITGPTGRVMAVEPHPRIFTYLEENARINGFRHIDVRNVAVSDSPGSVRFTNSHSDDQNQIDPSGCVQVMSVTLDSLAASFPGRIDLLKIDVEGHEPQVLAGGRETIARTQAVLIEVWEKNLNVLDHFSDFSIRTLNAGPRMRNVLCVR